MDIVSGGRRAGALRNGDHSDRADVRFARPNIQIYDAHVVDLYQWGGARYLVGANGAEKNAKRSDSSSAPDRILERITLAFEILFHPEGNPGATIEKRNLH